MCENSAFEIQLFRGRDETGIQVVLKRIHVLQLQMSVAISKRSGITAGQKRETGPERQLVQVSAQFALAIVVVNLAALKQKVPDAEIEYAGPALRARFLVLRWRQVGVAVAVRKNPDYRVFDADIIYIPSLAKQRSDGDSKMKCVGLQQRRIWIRCRSMDDDAIEIDHGIDTRPVNREILDLDLAAEGFTRPLLASPEEIRVKAFTV